MSKVAIVGCGAMGSVYAALMVSAGHEVHAVTLWPDHADAMATRGLRCEGASGDRTVPIHASTTTEGIGHCDLGITPPKHSTLRWQGDRRSRCLGRRRWSRPFRTASARLWP